MFATTLDAMVDFKLISPPFGSPQSYYDNRYVSRAAAQLRGR